MRKALGCYVSVERLKSHGAPGPLRSKSALVAARSQLKAGKPPLYTLTQAIHVHLKLREARYS